MWGTMYERAHVLIHLRPSREHLRWWYVPVIRRDGCGLSDVCTYGPLRDPYLPPQHQPSRTNLPFDPRSPLDSGHQYQGPARHIYSLLLVLEFSDPINTVVTLNYHWDEVQFKEEAQKHIRKHASMLRAEWREEIVG